MSTPAASVEREIPALLAGLPLEELPAIHWDYPPCIYFLLDEGQVVYVGKTVGLVARIGQHLRPNRWDPSVRKRFQRVLYIPCSETLLDRVEGALIKILNPRDNRAGLGPKSMRRVVNLLEENALCDVGLSFMLTRRVAEEPSP
jgi:hypothetical protein